MISTCSELMTFSYPEKSFFEDNLLDADDWGKDASLGGNHSPDSLSPLNVDQLHYIPGYSSNSLQYDCLDSFLSNSKFCLVENDFPEEEQVPHTAISPISCTEKISITNNNSISIANTPLAALSPKCNIAPKLPINRSKSKVAISPSSNIVPMQNSLKMRNFKAIQVKKEPDAPITTSLPPCSLPLVSPTIVKLDNGQFYVAKSIKKPSVLINASKTQHNSKITTKRNSEFRVESIHTTSKDMNELKKYKRQQRMVKNRESACLSRQRKKEHLNMLESCVTEISSMNERLREENETLKQRIQALENENSNLRKKSKDNLKDKVKKSSVLFAIVFIFIFNVIGSSPERKDIIETIPYQKEVFLANRQLTFHSRSLLRFVGNSNSKPDEMKVKYFSHLHQKPYNSNLMNDLITSYNDKNKKMSKYKKRDKVLKFQNSREELDSVDCEEQLNETYIKRINNALNGLVKGLRKENDNSKLSRKDARKLLKNTRDIDTMITNSSVVSKMNKAKMENCTHRKHRHRSTLFKNFKLDKYRKNLPERRDVLLNLTSKELANVIQKSIDVKSDTFYVVTSWKDFLTILPSTNNSNFHRPKVSFMIPAFQPNNNETFNDSNKLTMLKIDCNVIDTTLVQLDQNMVSKSLLTRL